MIPYIIVLIITLANCLINTRLSNNFVFIILFLFSACRYDVGYDYASYMDIMWRNDDFQLDRMELIERYLLYLSINLKFYQLFFIVNSAVVFFCVKRFVQKNSINVAISYLVFLCMPLMLTQSYSIVRHWSALAVILYASTFLFEKKYITYGALCLLSVGFHNVGYIGFLLLPMVIFNLNLKWNIIILIISFFAGELLKVWLNDTLSGVDLYISNKFINYLENEEGESGLSRIPYVFLFFDIIYLFALNYNHEVGSKIWSIATIYNIGCCLMFLFKAQVTLSLRFSTPFIAFIIVLFPHFLVKPLLNNKWMAIKYLTAIILLCGLFIITISIYNGSIHRSQYLPYRTFLSK